MPDTTLPGSYISVTDFSESYTGIDPSTLQPGELARAIRRASGLVDRHCKQILYSTVDAVTLMEGSSGQGFSINRNTGFIEAFPRQFPIQAVTSAGLRSTVTAPPVNIDPSLVQIARRYLIIEGDYRYYRMPGYGQLMLDLNYTNGYPATTLATQASSGQAVAALVPQPRATTVQGFLPGVQVEFSDGTPETMTVQSVNGNNVTFTTNFTQTHNPDTFVSPPEFEPVKMATIWIVSYLIKTRGIGVVSLRDEAITAGKQGTGEQNLLADAIDALVDFTVYA